ncbi:MurR/RpiR family transcriptional regulator (plasmid) [Leisingera sp. M527]|uniref:MurR/RpiR family transcriptional regulator n=1 Tax=Leisingera sp. M527 TaxID=2867014 RepID=UPI0021A33073|nr:MurR/RpiR family transcriptional regulator [Leisingera sp. M527]UWQ35387.1 MurR/RpiR family transcriptional regulator [Leisingera sp. M527]
MSDTSNIRLIDRIHRLYDMLPKSERQIADSLLEFPGDAVAFQSSEIATRSGSSNAAVSRLVKRLGYNDFREVQKEVRDAQMIGIPLYRVTSAATVSTSDGWAQSHLEADILSLKRTYELLDAAALEESIKAAINARRVWTLGFRNGYFFADYMKRQLTQYRPHVDQLPSPGQSVMEELGDATKDDLVIVVGVRRRPPQLHRYLEVLGKMDVPVLYITDHQAVSSTQHANWVLRCHTAANDQLDTYAGLVSLLGMFCNRVASGGGKHSRSYNENIEKWVAEADETDPQN